MGRKFTDNALTTLATSITAGSTTLGVAAGKGDNFPAITGKGTAGQTEDYFIITMEDSSGNREKIRVEHRASASDTLGSAGYPLVRGYDGTIARAWNAGDSVDLRFEKSEAQDLEDKVQAGGAGRAFGKKASTTSGLNFGFYGGIVLNDGALAVVADGAVALSASQTNYVERTPAGVVSANIVGFSADKIALYTITTDANGITAITDQRAIHGFSGKLTKSVAGGANVTLNAAEARNEIIELTGALTADIDVVFPALKRMWLIINSTTGGYLVTAKVAGQAGVGVGPDAREILFGDGTDLVHASPGVPVGVMLDMPFTGVEPGYLECDGANVARATYARLFRKLMKSATVTFASGTDRVNWTKHGLKSSDVFKFTTTGSAPTGLTAGTTYFVVNPTANDFQLSATEGGAAIDFTTDGTGTHTGIHAPHGDGDGATTFTLPDSRRRATVGRGGTPTATLGARVGAAGGAETHTLVTAEMPAHGHTTSTDGSHTHQLWGRVDVNNSPYPAITGLNKNAQAAADALDPAGSHSHTVNNTGGGGAHNNMPPSLVVTKMIKF